MSTEPKKVPTPRTKGKGIMLDRVHPSDFLRLNLVYCCEQCSHFAPSTQSCTIGYKADLHLQKNQLNQYERNGTMAFCRYLEID